MALNSIDSARAYWAYLRQRSPALAAAVQSKLVPTGSQLGDLVNLDYGVSGTDVSSWLSSASGSASGALSSLINTAVNLAPQIVKTAAGLQEIKDNAARAKNGQAPIYRNADGSLVTVTPGVQGSVVVAPAQGTPANNYLGGKAGTSNTFFGMNPVLLAVIGIPMLIVLLSSRK